MMPRSICGVVFSVLQHCIDLTSGNKFPPVLKAITCGFTLVVFSKFNHKMMGFQLDVMRWLFLSSPLIDIHQ